MLGDEAGLSASCCDPTGGHAIYATRQGLWALMVVTGLVGGVVALILTALYARWLDDTVVADMVL